MKKIFAAALVSTIALAGSAFAADKYMLDSSHSQIVFEYNHLGFSTTYGMFSGFTGEIMFDEANPAASSVSVNISSDSMITGWDARTKHLLSGDFLNAADAPEVTFNSTSIKVTGDNTAVITGDLMLNGVTKSVDLDAKLNKMADHPMAKKPWAGFDATTTLKRSDFNMGKFAPFVSDDVKLMISIEAVKN